MIEQKTSLLKWWNQAPYCVSEATWQLLNNKGRLKILATNPFTPRVKFFLANFNLVVAGCLIAACMSSLPYWGILILVMLCVVPNALCAFSVFEYRQLLKIGDPVLEEKADGSWALYGGKVRLDEDDIKSLLLVSDYRPSFYQGDRFEASFTMFYEVHVLSSSNGVRERHVVMSGRHQSVCFPIANQLAELKNWPIDHVGSKNSGE